jgi:hypothetical protein
MSVITPTPQLQASRTAAADPLTDKEFNQAINEVNSSLYKAQLGHYIERLNVTRGNVQFGSAIATQLTDDPSFQETNSSRDRDLNAIVQNALEDMSIRHNVEELTGFLKSLKESSEDGNQTATLVLNEVQRQLGLNER